LWTKKVWFTSSIKSEIKSLGLALKKELTLTNVIKFQKSNISYGPVQGGFRGDKFITSINVNLPAAPDLYEKIDSNVYVYGRVDDYIRFYLNGVHIHSTTWGWNNLSAFVETLNPSFINAGTDYFNLQVQENNKFDIYCYNADSSYPAYMYIYSLVITITTYSK